jgi:hypothetical protein
MPEKAKRRRSRNGKRYPVTAKGNPKELAACAGMLPDMTPVLCKAESSYLHSRRVYKAAHSFL